MEPFIATCAHCGEPFMARRQAARYCGPTCRQRARRARDQGVVVALPGPDAAPAALTYADRFLESVRVKFAEAGRLDDPLALLALSLAEQAMRTDLAPSVRCGVTATFRRTFADAMRGVPKPGSVDELRGRRQAKGLR